MITDEQIKTLATKNQTIELNVRREYFQHIFLSYFYEQPQTRSIYFKGGTALKMVHKSPRFSDDLDFSTNLSGIEEIEEAIINTLSQIEKENIKVSLNESKETSGGYLGIINFEDQVAIHLQISLRVREKTGQIVNINNDFIPDYTILVLSQDQLVDEKLAALFDRRKPRDFYDLYFMLRASLISPKKRNLLAKAKDLLKATKINFENELKQYLPKSHWAIIKDFKKTLEREISRII